MRRGHKCAVTWFAFFIVFMLISENGLCGDYPAVGDTLPAMVFSAPSFQGDNTALGIGDKETFTLKNLNADVILLEVIGVYCAQCYKQAPDFNKMYRRLKKKKLLGKVGMFGLAAGATVPEVENLRESRKYLFPLVTDENYDIHKLLGEPKTPFTMILSPEGEVLYTHLGIIDDTPALFSRLKELTE